MIKIKIFIIGIDQKKKPKSSQAPEIKKKPSLLYSINIPYSNLQNYLQIKKEKIKDKIIIFYCAVGERSALAIQICQNYKIKKTYHLVGGINNL